MGVGAELRRNSGSPFIAGGTDIGQYALVKLTGAWQVQPCATVTDQPVGLTRASAPANRSIDVRDSGTGDIVRAQCVATVAVGNEIGVASVGATAGASGNFQVPLLGPVSKGASLSIATWSAGQALENANPGNTFAFRISPRQLSGLS